MLRGFQTLKKKEEASRKEIKSDNSKNFIRSRTVSSLIEVQGCQFFKETNSTSDGNDRN